MANATTAQLSCHVLCAKFHSNHFTTIWITAEWNFHYTGEIVPEMGPWVMSLIAQVFQFGPPDVWNFPAQLTEVWWHINGLVQERRNSSAMALHLSCIKPLTYASVKCVIIDLNNGLVPIQCLTFTWTNLDLLSVRSLETNFRKFWIKTEKYSSKKIFLKILPARLLNLTLSQ